MGCGGGGPYSDPVREACFLIGAQLGKYAWQVEEEMPVDEFTWWCRKLRINLVKPVARSRGLTGQIDSGAFLRRLKAQGLDGAEFTL
jgi:hypothetical protein